jgi:hypothetical protein
MFNIQKHLRHAVLALGLAAVSLTASATLLPTYHIDVADTATADITAIDFLFSSADDAAAVTASLSHFTGIQLTELDREGAVGGTSDVFTIGNAGSFNYLLLGAEGPFAFDLNFSEGFLGAASTFGANSFLSIALYNSLGELIGDPEGTLQFSLSKTGVVATSTSSLASLTEVTSVAVPEPADWALMLTGLAGVFYMTRLNGRASTRRSAAA